MAFTDEEVAYLRSRPVARVATVSADGQPDVVPLAFEFDGTFLGRRSRSSRRRHPKFRNVRAGIFKVALVIDDMASFVPFITRSLRIYGHADQPVERDGLVGRGLYMRITPTISWSWNMAGEPAGDTWNEPRRTIHEIPDPNLASKDR
jgi:pyridoxamine 5'-phosphate oxidase family protein